MHKIINAKSILPESYSKYNDTIQSVDSLFQINEIRNLNLQQFILPNNELIPLEHLRFDMSRYNLFVVDEKLSTLGNFTLPFSCFPQNILLTKDTLKQMLNYPSLIVKKNSSFRQSPDMQFAYIAKVFRYEQQEKIFKFWYVGSIEIKQKLLNLYPTMFGIIDSGQTNELDECCMRIKSLNLIKILNLEVDNV